MAFTISWKYTNYILISLQIMTVATKKYVSSSDESIENLLYYKDCQKNKIPETTPTTMERLVVNSPPPRGMECPFPKMCCALTCGGNECGSPMNPYADNIEKMNLVKLNGNMGPGGMHRPNFSPVQPLAGPMPPAQPQDMPRRKKKVKPPMKMQMQTPIGARRDFGFTKDRIKSLINQDDDIRKILKDLVRVTMQKVDLVDMINTRKAGSETTTATHRFPKANSQVDEEDENEDLE